MVLGADIQPLYFKVALCVGARIEILISFGVIPVSSVALCVGARIEIPPYRPLLRGGMSPFVWGRGLKCLRNVYNTLRDGSPFVWGRGLKSSQSTFPIASKNVALCVGARIEMRSWSPKLPRK